MLAIPYGVTTFTVTTSDMASVRLQRAEGPRMCVLRAKREARRSLALTRVLYTQVNGVHFLSERTRPSSAHSGKGDLEARHRS